jgi:diacylglycerol kinase (ATP)
MKKIIVLANLKAGKGRSADVTKQVVKMLEERRIDYSLYSGNWPATLDGYTDVFLVGGDGTLNYFINLYSNISIPIALFKGGSGNDSAWKLYGDKSVQEYFEVAIKAEPKRIDGGVCNEKLFINGLGIGFDASIVEHMKQKKLLFKGHLAYLWAVVRNIFFYRESMLKIELDGKTFHEEFFMISIANGSRYGGGFLVAPNADMSDGLFDVVLIKMIHPLKRLPHLPSVQKGKHLELLFVKSHQSDSVRISSDKQIAAHCDGELIYATDFKIKMQSNKYLFYC